MVVCSLTQVEEAVAEQAEQREHATDLAEPVLVHDATQQKQPEADAEQQHANCVAESWRHGATCW